MKYNTTQIKIIVREYSRVQGYTEEQSNNFYLMILEKMIDNSIEGVRFIEKIMESIEI